MDIYIYRCVHDIDIDIDVCLYILCYVLYDVIIALPDSLNPKYIVFLPNM